MEPGDRPAQAFAATSSRIKTLRVCLVRPSKYDDDGYVVQHWRGVIPSNTLACLAGLTEDVRRRGSLGATKIEGRVYDESVERLPVQSICRRVRRERDVRTIICLVGVQSCMFDRAADLAQRFRAGGVDVLIGGFHVSGAMATARETPPEIQRLLDAGVTVVLGEVEHRWESLLQDAAADRLKPVYNFLAEKPSLADAPIPSVSGKYLKRFLMRDTATVDTSRGCPFGCSFCTIINVQGRRIRARSPEAIAEVIRHNFRKHGISRYFFTDDNFARNPNAMAILDEMARLRIEHRIPVEFMMQADAAAARIPGFIDKAQAAGAYSVFIGLESLNPKNLSGAGKTQNQVQTFRDTIAAWRQAGIVTHASYIIGFPNDTVASVREDLRRLCDEVQPDVASFFMLTPLPGSQDHQEMREAGQWMHPDLSRYDGQHATSRHPHLSAAEWEGLYTEAWRTFYSPENMKRVLRRVHPRLYWPLLTTFFWYKWSSLGEKGHPMLTGALRLKARSLRRPGFAVDRLWDHGKKRLGEIWGQVKAASRLFLEFEDLWLQTRPWTPAEYRLVELRQALREGAAKWHPLEALAEQFEASRRMASKRWAWFMSRWRVLSTHGLTSRQRLSQSWQRVLNRTGLRRWLGLTPLQAVLNALREARLALSFAAAMLAQA